MITILCFGNEWHGDDGFGLAVYEELQQLEWPSSVNLYFCGTNSLMAWHQMKGASKVIIVDAEQAQSREDEIGSLNWRSPEELLAASPRNLHDGGVEEMLRHQRIDLDNTHHSTLFTILTVNIETISAFSQGLSPAIQRSVPDAVNQIVERIDNWEASYAC